MNNLKQFINKDNLLGYGTSRIVFDLKDGTVVKIPYNNLGIKANKQENDYYLENNQIVARILKYEKNIIIQEKLSDLIAVPMEYTKEHKVKEYLKNKFPQKDLSIIDSMLYSRAQVGLNQNGELRFYDYEDSKIKNEFIIEPFMLTDEWIDMCIEYMQECDLNDIREWETFEDHRGFLTEN